MTYGVVLAADQPLYLAAMCREVGEDPRLEVVGTAATGHECVDAAFRLQPHVVLVDADLDGVGGIDVLRRIHADEPGISVCIIAARPAERDVLEAARGGARGYLDKRLVNGPELRRQLLTAGDGGEAYDSRTLTVMLRALRGVESPRRATTPVLTPRQVEVLRLIAAGASNAEIAVSMYVSVNTVKTYVRGLFARLDVTDRAEAVGRAYEVGLLRRSGLAPTG